MAELLICPYEKDRISTYDGSGKLILLDTRPKARAYGRRTVAVEDPMVALHLRRTGWKADTGPFDEKHDWAATSTETDWLAVFRRMMKEAPDEVRERIITEVLAIAAGENGPPVEKEPVAPPPAPDIRKYLMFRPEKELREAWHDPRLFGTAPHPQAKSDIVALLVEKLTTMGPKDGLVAIYEGIRADVQAPKTKVEQVALPVEPVVVPPVACPPSTVPVDDGFAEWLAGRKMPNELIPVWHHPAVFGEEPHPKSKAELVARLAERVRTADAYDAIVAEVSTS